MSSWKAFVRKVTPIIRVWATLTKAAERGETKQMWKRLEQATKRRFLLLPLFHPLATLLLGSLAYTFLFDWSVGSPLEPAFLNSFKENYTSLLSYQFFCDLKAISAAFRFLSLLEKSRGAPTVLNVPPRSVIWWGLVSWCIFGFESGLHNSIGN